LAIVLGMGIRPGLCGYYVHAAVVTDHDDELNPRRIDLLRFACGGKPDRGRTDSANSVGDAPLRGSVTAVCRFSPFYRPSSDLAVIIHSFREPPDSTYIG
jgi:hypothetical protein